MYEIRKNGGLLALMERVNYICLHPDGFYLLCSEAEARGIAVDGTPYHLEGREEMPGCETVLLREIDSGEEMTRQAERARQTEVAARFYARTVSVPDDIALEMPDLFLSWAEALKEGKQLAKGTVINNSGKLYRVLQAVTPMAHQEPGGAGMTAIYASIDLAHAGTQDDPIPAARGMEYIYGKYYSDPEDGRTYLCTRQGTSPGQTVTLQYLPHELIGHYFAVA